MSWSVFEHEAARSVRFRIKQVQPGFITNKKLLMGHDNFLFGWNLERCSERAALVKLHIEFVRPMLFHKPQVRQRQVPFMCNCWIYQSCHFTFNHSYMTFQHVKFVIEYKLWIHVQSFNESIKHHFKFFDPPSDVFPYPWNIQSSDLCFNSLNLCWR